MGIFKKKEDAASAPVTVGDTATYTVPGMSCGHCEKKVSEKLRAVEGVESVDVDLGTKLVTVTGPSLEDSALRAAIAAAGYEPQD